MTVALEHVILPTNHPTASAFLSKILVLPVAGALEPGDLWQRCRIRYWPRMNMASAGCTTDASIAITTSPAAGTGVGTSSTDNTSAGSPARSNRAAPVLRIMAAAPAAGHEGRRGLRGRSPRLWAATRFCPLAARCNCPLTATSPRSVTNEDRDDGVGTPLTGTLGRCPRPGIRSHSGTVQRLVGPVDLARFDSTVKVPTEGSCRTSQHPGRRRSCSLVMRRSGRALRRLPPASELQKACDCRRLASAIEPAMEDSERRRSRASFSDAQSVALTGPSGVRPRTSH
jgi:hypothetical protein